ncbi:MAG TPA: hypothetical protein PKW63_10840 [Vicinamibacterales bacterium]|nr:hypothetical protein [Acidobacteriota bacterium]HQX82243.1 hypothetical protein [Vicinamibacterales bacterium]
MTHTLVPPLVRGRWWGPLSFAVVLLPLAARLVPWPELATVLRWAQHGIVLAGLTVYARHGIRMRRGVWTAQSWRWFLASVVVSLAGVALMLAVAAGVDNGWAWIGERRSTHRMVVGLSVTAAGIIGVAMFAGAMHRFASDDPVSQYDSRLSRLWRRVAGCT